MSIRLSSEVWTLKVDQDTRELLMALADHANDEGYGVRPSIARLAYKIGDGTRNADGDYKPTRTVQRRMKLLRKMGALVLTRRSGQHRANEYRLDLSVFEKKEPFFASGDSKGDSLSPLSRGDKAGFRGDKSDVRGDTTLSPEPSFEPSIEPSYRLSETAEKQTNPQKVHPTAEHSSLPSDTSVRYPANDGPLESSFADRPMPSPARPPRVPSKSDDWDAILFAQEIASSGHGVELDISQTKTIADLSNVFATLCDSVLTKDIQAAARKGHRKKFKYRNSATVPSGEVRRRLAEMITQPKRFEVPFWIISDLERYFGRTLPTDSEARSQKAMRPTIDPQLAAEIKEREENERTRQIRADRSPTLRTNLTWDGDE